MNKQQYAVEAFVIQSTKLFAEVDCDEQAAKYGIAR